MRCSCNLELAIFKLISRINILAISCQIALQWFPYPYASVTSNHGLHTIYARQAEWSAHRNFTSVLFSWTHQAMGPIQHDTAVHLWFGRIIRRTPWLPSAMPGPKISFSNFNHGYIKKFYWSSHIFHWSSHFFISRGPRTDKFRRVWVKSKQTALIKL